MEPSDGVDRSEWFAPRANRQLISSAVTPGESGTRHTDSSNVRCWLSKQQAHNNASFVPDTPTKNTKDDPGWRNSSPRANKPPSFSTPGVTGYSVVRSEARNISASKLQGHLCINSGSHINAYNSESNPDNGFDTINSKANTSQGTESPVFFDSDMASGQHCNSRDMSSARPSHRDHNDDIKDNHSEVSNNSSEFERSGFWKKIKGERKMRHLSNSSSVEMHKVSNPHRGFNIPAKEMSQDEAGYLNRSNTSLNKSQTSLRSDDSQQSWHMQRSVSMSTMDDNYDPSTSTIRSSSSLAQNSDFNLSFSVNDVSPAFLVRRFYVLFENKKLEECSVLMKRMSASMLHIIVGELDLKGVIRRIPYSLGVLHGIYVKLFDAENPENFPAKHLFPKYLVAQFIEWLSSSDKISYQRQQAPYAHKLPLIHDILQIIAHVEPEIFHHIAHRKRVLDNCLQRLGNHGLVSTSDNHLVTLHDALKVKFTEMIHQLKSGIQRLDDTTVSHKTPVLRSLHRGRAPSGSSHQRLMEISQLDIQQRIIKNKSLLNVVEPALVNTYLDCLMGILEERIDADKNVLFLFTELNKELPSGLHPDQMLAPMFQNLSRSYGKVLDVLKELPPCGKTCKYCDEQGLICDWDVSTPDVVPNELERQGSTQSFGTGPGQGAPQGPIDREKQQRVPGTARVYPRPHRDHPSGPISIPVTSANGTAHNNLPCSLPTSTGNLLEDRLETDDLRNQVTYLRKELSKSRDSVKKLQERETQLKDRLSAQALKHIEKTSTKFEDLSLGENRPTQLIRRYGNLYSETRLDAFDALEELPEIADFDDLKGKLLFSVVVLAFRAVQRSLADTRSKVRHLLCLPHPESKSSFAREPIVRDLEDTISVYLRRFVDRYDSSKNVETPLHDLTEEVCHQVWSTLYDYPSLKECSGLQQYIKECVRLAWALSVQNPPLLIEYDSKVFQEDAHTRFHTSDSESDRIKSILWPSLREGDHHGLCVYRGVVVT